MHDSSHSPMTPAEAASLRDASPVDEALLQRIRAALVGRNATPADTVTDADTDADAEADTNAGDGAQTETETETAPDEESASGAE